jgi:hypothetical protein
VCVGLGTDIFVCSGCVSIHRISANSKIQVTSLGSLRGPEDCNFSRVVMKCRDPPIHSVLTLDAGLLARSQYPEGPSTGHLDTGFSCFPFVYKRILRWFPSFLVATTCLSCSPPNLNFLVTFFPTFVYM